MIVHTPLGAVGLDESGSGVPVLLHGFPHDRTLRASQLASPAPGFRCIAPDLPGFGESVQLAEPHLDAWADWAVALLDTLGIDRDDSTATLATITVPTLILCGDEDGHASNFEAPEVFNALLSDFLAATLRSAQT